MDKEDLVLSSSPAVALSSDSKILKGASISFAESSFRFKFAYMLLLIAVVVHEAWAAFLSCRKLSTLLHNVPDWLELVEHFPSLLAEGFGQEPDEQLVDNLFLGCIQENGHLLLKTVPEGGDRLILQVGDGGELDLGNVSILAVHLPPLSSGEVGGLKYLMAMVVRVDEVVKFLTNNSCISSSGLKGVILITTFLSSFGVLRSEWQWQLLPEQLQAVGKSAVAVAAASS